MFLKLVNVTNLHFLLSSFAQSSWQPETEAMFMTVFTRDRLEGLHRWLLIRQSDASAAGVGGGGGGGAATA